MRSARRAAWVAAFLAFTVQFPRPAYGFHTIFHFMVDRVDVDGNAYGPLDGTPDVVDEFDDGDLASWSVLYGTAYAGQGSLHLTNPGTHVNVVVPLDLSDVAGMAELQSGLGSFRVQSVWTTRDIPPNNLIHMSLWSLPEYYPAPYEVFGIDVTNFAPVGLAISQHLVRLSQGTWGWPEHTTVPIDPAAITGPLVLRIDVDDTAKTGQASFSIDGGTSFQTPFPPTPVFEGTTDIRVLLGADHHAAPSPPPPTTTTTLPRCHATPLDVRRATIDLDFRRAERDALVLSGTVQLPPDVARGGQTVLVDVGGIERTFVLDAAGRGTSGRDRIRIGRGRRAPVVVRLRGGLGEHLADEGLRPGHGALEATTIAIHLEFGGMCFDKAQFFAYRATPRRAHARDV